MAKYASFGKRENEKKKQARRVEKQNRKEERKSSGKAASFEDMIAYVDENGMALFVDLCTANNTIAIVMAGPIAKEISEEYDIDPKRSASLLDIFTSVGQGMIPYGAQLLSAATLTGLTPFDIIPNLFYPVLMGVSAILFIVFKKQN